MSFDPADPGFLDDPYPAFAALRALGPVHAHPPLGMPVAVSHAACSRSGNAAARRANGSRRRSGNRARRG